MGKLFIPNFVMRNDVIEKTMDCVIKSCQEIHKSLELVTKPVETQKLICQFKKTILFAKYLMCKLMTRSRDNSDTENKNLVKNSTPETDMKLMRKIFHDIRREFAVFKSPNTNYRAPLAHILLDRSQLLPSSWIWPQMSKSEERQLFEILIKEGLDIYSPDSNGNSSLHVAVSSDVNEQIVELLLESDVHSHLRNKSRNTPLDVMFDPKFSKRMIESRPNVSEYLQDFRNTMAIIEEHNLKLRNLKCIAATFIRDMQICYQESLPDILIRFVDMH